jgi:PAS domain S-box-containing protein
MFDNDSNLKEVIQQQALELRASEARFHNIVTISTDGIVIVDNVGKILFVNPAAKSLFGRKAEELLGEPFGFPIVAGETTVLDMANREGKRIIAEMRVVAAEWEQKPAYLATLHDITERREIEKGLEKARKELAATKISEDAAREYSESIINTVREPLIAMDQDLRVVSASRSFYEVFKVTPKETVGQLIYDLGNKQWNIPKLRELLETILPEKATFDNYEVEHEFSTIGSRIMLLNARQIKRVWGKERIILLAIEDITERKKLEQKINQYSKELERSNVELSNFGSIVAHDLGAPLRAVSGFAGLLQKRYKEKLDAEADEYISHIVEGTGRMQHLIKDLLEYARVGTSSKPLVQVDVNIIIEKALANLMFEITESRAVITADTLPTVSADDTRLIQLFQNLVGNALKYRTNTPHIYISAERKDGEWLFRISDNGIGIEPRQFERIFQIFQRLHTREEYSGTGIGLAICKKIVERLGGRIWVESKPGEGSTFFFTLPATE